jgi:hypothetical protein
MLVGSGVFERYIPGMSKVPFKVEGVPASGGGADYVAAAEAILRDHFEQHHLPPVMASPASATSVHAALNEELTTENVLAHLAWQRSSQPAGPVFLGPFDPWILVVTLALAPFLGGFLGEAGKDAYLECKRLFARLSRPKGGAEPIPVYVLDADSGVELHLRSRYKRGLPDRAWNELVAIELPSRFPRKCTGKALVWDDTWSFMFKARDLVKPEGAEGRITGEELFAVPDDAVSEHDHWVLELKLRGGPLWQAARPGRRWLRRLRSVKERPRSGTLGLVWQAQERRWILPR